MYCTGVMPYHRVCEGTVSEQVAAQWLLSLIIWGFAADGRAKWFIKTEPYIVQQSAYYVLRVTRDTRESIVLSL